LNGKNKEIPKKPTLSVTKGGFLGMKGTTYYE
jgi:hypothetical protein